MRIYRGKFDFFDVVKNEAITVIVPNSIQTGEPVYVSWKWSDLKSVLCSSPHFFDVGTFTKESDGKANFAKISFSHSQYHFDAIFGYDFNSLVLRAKFGRGMAQDPIVLSLVHHSPVDLSSAPRFFMGSFSCDFMHDPTLGARAFAKDETFLLVVPNGFAHNHPILAFSQWYVDNEGEHAVKTNIECLDRVQSGIMDGVVKVAFRDGGDYSFSRGELSGEGTAVIATIESLQHGRLSNLVLEQIQPIPMSSAPVAVTSTFVKNDTEEMIHCEIVRGEADGPHWSDTVLNVGGFVLAAAGFPGVPVLKKLLDATKWAASGRKFTDAIEYALGGGGTIVGATAATFNFTGNPLVPQDASTSGTLAPGQCLSLETAEVTSHHVKLTRTFLRTPPGDGTVQSIVTAIYKKELTSGSTIIAPEGVRAIINDATYETVLFQHEAPNAPQPKEGLLIQFPLIEPVRTEGGTPDWEEKASPDLLLDTDLFRFGNDTMERFMQTLDQLISQATARTNIFKYAAGVNVQYKAASSDNADVLGLRNGVAVLRLKKCRCLTNDRSIPLKPVGNSNGPARLSVDEILDRIYNNRPTGGGYYWAYTELSLEHGGWTLLGVPVNVDRASIIYTGDEANSTYLVSTSPPCKFRAMGAAN